MSLHVQFAAKSRACVWIHLQMLIACLCLCACFLLLFFCSLQRAATAILNMMALSHGGFSRKAFQPPLTSSSSSTSRAAWRRNKAGLLLSWRAWTLNFRKLASEMIPASPIGSPCLDSEGNWSWKAQRSSGHTSSTTSPKIDRLCMV